MENSKKKPKSDTMSFKDKDGTTREQLREIAEYWTSKTDLHCSQAGMLKMIIKKYHRALMQEKPESKELFNFHLKTNQHNAKESNF